ncbi:MAG: insulinase family protein [Acidobacteria bacterium]|nr:insulinase family protein [Acidobacteriota bacterium]
MKKPLQQTSLLLALAILLGSGYSAAAQATDWKQIKIAPLPEFHPKEPKRIQLPNGMVIFLQEDHELPLIDGVARIRGGSRSEPAAKTGLLDIYGETWRTGGSKSQTGDQLDDFLEARAAKVETGSNADSTTISLSCLKGDFDDVFKVFSELLRQPQFREDKIDIVRKQMFDAISRRNDDVDDIVGREAVKLAYGADNPYARENEYATVAAVTRQDLLDWHQAHVAPNNIILGLVGDFDSAAMEAKLRAAFGAWAKGPEAKKEEIAFHPAKPGYYLVTKEDVNQSNIQMVTLGTVRSNPDYYAIRVFNEAFGGGFSSRLFREVRTNKGLAYAVGGGIGTTFDHPGILRLVTSTKSQSTVEAIQAIFAEIDKLAQSPLTDTEIQQAKDSILNGFVFNFDSAEKVLQERMAYEYYGYPANYLEQFRSGVEKVTAADVARVAAKYLHRDQLAVLVVGNPPEFDKPLSSLGAVKEVDITIPPPPGAEKAEEAKPSASNPAGKALAAKIAAALGGEAKLQAVKAVKMEIASTQNSPQGEVPITVNSTIVFPDQLHAALQGPMGNVTLVATPKAAFMAMEGMGVRDLPAAQKTEMLAQIKRDLIYIGQHASDPAFVFAAAGSEKIGATEAQVLDVSGDGLAVRLYVDPSNGRVLRETYQTVGRSGPVEAVTEFADWQEVSGLTLPRVHKNKQGGEDSSAAQYKSVQVNPAVDAKLFEKPAE